MGRRKFQDGVAIPLAGMKATRWSSRPLIHPAALLHLPSGKVTERFSRWSDGQILYRFTVEDPSLYTSSWSGEMALNVSAEPPYEYACHEGNYALPSILAGARQMEREGRSRQAIKPYAGNLDVSEGHNPRSRPAFRKVP
jgi:hypothetical protein